MVKVVAHHDLSRVDAGGSDDSRGREDDGIVGERIARYANILGQAIIEGDVARVVIVMMVVVMGVLLRVSMVKVIIFIIREVAQALSW